MATYQSVTPDDRIDVKPHLERARESRRAAELLHTEGLYADALTRAHQATVHAERALLATEKRAPSTVRDVHRLATLHFLATDQLEGDHAAALDALALARARADDQPRGSVSDDQSAEALSRANALLDDVAEYLSGAGYLT